LSNISSPVRFGRGGAVGILDGQRPMIASLLVLGYFSVFCGYDAQNIGDLLQSKNMNMSLIWWLLSYYSLAKKKLFAASPSCEIYMVV